MKRTTLLFLAAVIACLAIVGWVPRPSTAVAPPPQIASGTLSIALTGARLFLSPTQTPVDHGVVIISNGKIIGAGSRGKVQIPGGIGILDCTGMYILPGFQNSSVQLSQSEWLDAAVLPPDTLASQMQAMFSRYGFTSIVDTESSLENTEALHDRIDSGDAPGPQIFFSGPPIYPPNGIPYYVKDSITPAQLKLVVQPANPGEAVKIVDERIAAGAQIIKLVTGSFVSKTEVVNMPVDVALAAATEAHSHHKLVFVEPGNVRGLQTALYIQADAISRPVIQLRGWRSGYLSQMHIHGISLIPTLDPLSNNPAFKAINSEVSDYVALNGHILFGDDEGRTAEYNPADEYQDMEHAGMTFQQVLASLTTEPAQLFGESKIRGKLQAGMDADLVVLTRNPEHDIRNLTQVLYTIRQGRFIYSVLNH